MYLSRLYTYHDQVNRAYIAALTEYGERVSERVIKLFSHVLNAHAIWVARITGQTPPYGVWEIHAVSYMTVIHEAAQRAAEQLWLAQDRLEDTVRYTNTKGIAYESKVSDILLHIVNHATYHRGQVAQIMSAAGLPMPGSDYVIMLRTASEQ